MSISALWLKVKDTKSESNSQRAIRDARCARGCGSRSKIQNLKAIHNPPQSHASSRLLWLKVKDTKSESNSQLKSHLGLLFSRLWLKVKDTKSESNSQRAELAVGRTCGCGSRSKIQNLKAIHNLLGLSLSRSLLWLKVKDTKSESNSQLSKWNGCITDVVAQGQRYKI